MAEVSLGLVVGVVIPVGAILLLVTTVRKIKAAWRGEAVEHHSVDVL